MGISGIASARLASALGASILVVNSGNIEDWSHKVKGISNCTPISQSDPTLGDRLSEVSFIVLSPGIARESEFLKDALLKGISIVSEIEFAYGHLNLEATKIISVTGTNGKTTTVTLLDILARGAGRSVFLGGNIGTPLATYALEVLLEKRKSADLVILELSSFQLESMKTFKSDVAAILNISANHGERYESVRDYALAKFHIADRMRPENCVFIGDLDGFESDFTPECKTTFLASPKSIEEFGSELKGKFHLIGEHNLSNLNFAKVLLESVGVNWKEGISTLADFHGVHYRLQKRPARVGVEVFNDAKSTNWEATITALKAAVFSFSNSKVHLILGGQLRGHGDELEGKLDNFKDSITTLYLFGESGKSLLLEASAKFKCEYYKNLEEVIKRIKEVEEDGVILFSPAFPSFDLYDNYVKRGEHFDELVSEYLGS